MLSFSSGVMRFCGPHMFIAVGGFSLAGATMSLCSLVWAILAASFNFRRLSHFTLVEITPWGSKRLREAVDHMAPMRDDERHVPRECSVLFLPSIFLRFYIFKPKII